MSVNIFTSNIDLTKYFVVKYFLVGKTSLRDAAWNLAIGQSIGNPNNRSVWETDQMFLDHSCFILHDEHELKQKQSGEVSIAFPLENLNLEEDGISQILCHIAGGQVDILEVEQCHVLDVKEDELLGDPAHCSLKQRVPLISNWLAKNAPNVMYTFCINGDSPYALQRAQFVADEGGLGIHINVWSGLGVYRAIRKQNPNLWIHFQKSGDKFFTDRRAPNHIYWPVVCKIAGWSGADSIHAGMIGGYMNQDDTELRDALRVLWNYNVIPALSCGMHPGLVQHINGLVGSYDWMANVGGAMHGHPMGTLAGGIAMRQAIDGNHGIEYEAAIKKWGVKENNPDLQYRIF